MTLAEGDLGSFGNLARAIGLTTSSGTNSAWFTDPAGGDGGNPTGLKTILSNPEQRDALVDFVDEALGPPAARTSGTQRWIPLFQNDDPVITVYAVVEALTGSVRVGIGVEHSTGTTAPFVASRLHVPLLQLPNGEHDDRADNGGDPKWLLIGHEGGRIDIEIDATFTAAPPVSGQAHLGGARVRLGIPTSSGDHLEFGLDLVDLQLPGATTPTTQTLDVDSLANIGTDIFEFMTGLVRAQVAALDLNDDTFRHVAGLTGILGLRDVADIPPLPLAELPTRGADALVGWVEQVLGDATARDAWLGELARLVGGTPDPTRNAVSLHLGDASILVGVRVDAGSGGHPVLVPWAEVGYATRAGVSVGGGLDLLRIDTGTGAVKAVPQIRVEAVFGADSAPAADRLIGTGSVQVGSVHVGVRLDDLSRPQFALELHDADVNTGGPPRHYDVLDLSSPDAALDAVDDVIEGAISDALDTLGDAGTLIRQLLGIDPPGGISAIKVTDLLGDPLGTVLGYYRELIASAPATKAVIASVQSLLTSAVTPVPGAGTVDDPWRITIAGIGDGGVGLAFWSAPDHLVIAAAVDLGSPVLDGLAVRDRRTNRSPRSRRRRRSGDAGTECVRTAPRANERHGSGHVVAGRRGSRAAECRPRGRVAGERGVESPLHG